MVKTKNNARAKRLLARWQPLKLTLQYARGLSSGQPLWVAPGHFYSPIPALNEIQHIGKDFWGSIPTSLPDIDMNDERQRALLDSFAALRDAQDLYVAGAPGRSLRYTPANDYFPLVDAICLALMLRHEAPQRVIEVGSGYSSAVMLDVNEYLLNQSIAFTCIDPYPERLRSLLRQGDQVEVLAEQVQRIPLERFAALESGDIVFIDSSHVAKTGSDVNFLFFEALPRLKPGVRVHIHDIVYPFEYPHEWSMEGRAWNEAYLLRAFLQHNETYRIELFPSYLTLLRQDWIGERAPSLRDNLGGSIWLRRVK